MNAEAFALRRRLYIIFKGEEGLDYGGVSRYDIQIYNKKLISKEMFRVTHPLCTKSYSIKAHLCSAHSQLSWRS